MKVDKLVRDASKIHAILKPTKTGSYVCTKECKIYIPYKYLDKKLARVENSTSIVGIFAITVDDKYYGVSIANAMMNITPTTTNTVDIDGEDYFEFIFEAGSTVIASKDLAKVDTLVYYISDHLMAKGHNPWFLNKDDIADLFETAGYHGGANLGVDAAILEMIAASRTRSSKDRTKYLRHVVKSQAEYDKDEDVTIIGLRNIALGPTNTTAKLMGSYFEPGLNSALVSPAKRTEKIEEILRR